MTQDIIDEAAAKGIRLYYGPLDCPTRKELSDANFYLNKIAKSALEERDYYKQLIVDGVDAAMSRKKNNVLE